MKIDSRVKFVKAMVTWALLILLLGSLVVWYGASETVPDQVTLVTGVEGGLYHQFGPELKKI